VEGRIEEPEARRSQKLESFGDEKSRAGIDAGDFQYKSQRLPTP
jgi:translation initiation factor IF-3